MIVFLGSVFSLPVLGAAKAVDPQLPLTYLNTAQPTSAATCTATLSSEDDLQAAIDNAVGGDTICLKAGARFVGNYVLRAKPGSSWTTIRSTELAAMKEGIRVGSLHVDYMATIATKNVAPALDADPGANFWRISGIELTVEPGLPSDFNFGLALGYVAGSQQTELSQLPSDIVFDRVWIHGSATCSCKRGLTFNGVRMAFVDGSISDIHVDGQDTQAIAGWNGTGPYKIVNNYLEAAGENVLFGGSDPANPTFVASDIEIRGNYFFKPLSWKETDPSYGGKHWTVKNLFEIKTARRVLVDGNIFRNSWVDGQEGVGIVIKSSMQGDGKGCAPCDTTDITFSNNIIQGVTQAFAIVGQEGPGGAGGIPGPLRGARLKISNVLIHPIPGYLFSFSVNDSFGPLDRFGEFQDIQITHITGLAAYNIAKIDYESASRVNTSSPNLVIRDSILERHEYGFGAGTVEGKGLLDNHFAPYTWEKVLLLNTSGIPDSTAYLTGKYPLGTIVVEGYKDLANYAQGEIDYHGYALAAKSRYRGAASDGTDIGVNFAALDAATARAINGGQPPVGPQRSPVAQKR